MTPDQLQQIIAALKEIAAQSKSYTLTGASDWPLLVVVGGILMALLGVMAGMIGLMWADLRNNIREGKAEWQAAVEKHEQELDEKCAANAQLMRDVEARIKGEITTIWQVVTDCQSDCCPRGGGRR